MDDIDGDEPELFNFLKWNEKWYEKVWQVLYCMAVLIVLWIAFIFAVALYLDAGRAELGYEEETRIEKKAWWE